MSKLSEWYRKIRANISKKYEELTEEQQMYLIFGVLVPSCPTIFFLVGCIILHESVSFWWVLAEAILACYTIVCSTLNIYVGLKTKRPLSVFLYIVLMIIIASVNIVVSNIDRFSVSLVNLIILIIIIAFLTCYSLRKGLSYLKG